MYFEMSPEQNEPAFPFMTSSPDIEEPCGFFSSFGSEPDDMSKNPAGSSPLSGLRPSRSTN